MGRRQNSGFTLLEVLAVVVIIGVFAAIMAPMVSEYLAAAKAGQGEEAARTNQMIAKTMAQWARDNGGRLPVPFSGNGYTSTVHNPSASTGPEATFNAALYDLPIGRNAINDDGRSARNVRVYQRLGGNTRVIPLYVRSGPSVILSYDLGVIYQTECPLQGSGCNPSAGSGVPGASPALTATNRSTWAVVPPDAGARFVSTLPAEMEQLAATARRVDRVRDALMGYYRGKQLAASSTDFTNWFPGSALAGKSPATNQGCRDGWYALNTSDVLPLIGLAREEFGVTAWGGRIEYCADFDPLAGKAPNAPPHAAALRFHASVSSGVAPDAFVQSNNVILTL